ncbi:MAG: ABC transporter ATP-binding protein [Nocardioidaceae bacterium]|nr:ABC transporter ATP-binding protein [Nocardioidaceae bacterium]
MTTSPAASPDMTTRPAKSGPAMRADDLHLTFAATAALRGASLTIEVGEAVALMGPSGSGKSTLLHCLAGILTPDRGDVHFAGRRLAGMSERERSELRLRSMGFVFQNSELIPELTLLENVALPLQLLGTRHRDARTLAVEALAQVGLQDEGERRTGAVSGGQQQRAAVARALVHTPGMVFADEPTGALDTVTGERVLQLLLAACSERAASLLLVTHDHRVAAHADRLLVIRDGVIGAGETA